MARTNISAGDATFPSGPTADSATVRVAVIESGFPIGDGIRSLIEQEDGLLCVGTFEDGESLLAAIPRLNPEVVLVDANLPGLNPVDYMALLKSQYPAIHV